MATSARISTSSFRHTRSHCRTLVLAGALVMLMAPSGAQAQDFPKVFLLPVLDLPAGVVATATKDLSTKLLKRFSGTVPVTILTDFRAVKMSAPTAADKPAAKATVEDARKLLAEGKKLKLKEPEKAIDMLKSAVSSFEALLPETHDFASLAEAHLQLGDALFREGLQDDGEVRAKLVASMGFVPKKLTGLDKNYANELTKTAKKLAGKAPGSISVDAAPDGAKVWVDGKDRGKAPVTVEELAPGVHYVLIEADGHASKVEKVDVVGNETSELVASLDKKGSDSSKAAKARHRLPAVLDAAIGSGRISPEARKVLAAFGEAAEAKFVVIPFIVPDGDVFFFRPFMFRVEDKKLAEMDRKIFASLSKTDKGIAETAAIIIKWAYAFPEDIIKASETVVIPVPEVKLAKVTKKSTIVEKIDSGKYAEDCDPDIEDCPEPRTKRRKTVKTRKRPSFDYDPDAGCDDEELDEVDFDLCMDAEAEWLETDCDPKVYYCDDIAEAGGHFDAGGGGGVSVSLPPVLGKWWFWTIVGAVAAGGITTGVILGSRNGVNANVCCW